MSRKASSTIAMAVFIALFVVLTLLTHAPGVRAGTLYVCPSGCAYTSIEAALEASSPGDTVSVGPGEYHEAIWMRGGVRIQGAGADKTTLISSFLPAVRGYPHEVSEAVLDGFTIICDSPNSAIHFDFPHEKETVSNCVIKNSTGQWHSGGIWIAFGATPTIISNTFIGNVLTDGDGGGAIFIEDAAPLISGNTFIGNSAKNGGAIAVYNSITYTATIVDNTFIGNSATSRGGAIHVERASPIIRNNHILSNTAQSGAGLAIDTGSNALLEFNEIAFNMAPGSGTVGGGVAIAGGSNARLNGNVVRRNSAATGGGIHILDAAPLLTNNQVRENAQAEIVVSNSSPHIANNVVWGAGASGVVGIDLYGSSSAVLANNIIAFEAYGIRGDGTAGPTIRYNNLWMNSAANYSGVTAEVNNLSVDPALRDAANGDCHLLAGSPMIDAGNNADAPPLDIDGDARPIDGDDDSIARADIGLDEYAVGAPTPTPTVTPLPPGTLVTVTLQYGLNGYAGAEDTYMDNYTEAGSFCTASLLKVGWRWSYQPILRFDLSPIPSDATVTRAILEVYTPAWSAASEITMGAYYITRTVTYCEANWNQARIGNLWGNPGAANTSTDRRPFPEATVTTQGPRRWYSLDLSGVTRGWLSGALANNGVVLRGSYEEVGYFDIDSAQSINVTQRPRLVVSYRTAGLTTPTPTPTATPRTPTPTSTTASVPTLTPTPTSTTAAVPTTTPTPTLTQVGGETTVVYQQGTGGYAGALDTYIYQYSADTNFRLSEPLKVGYKQQNAALVRFDVSAVPSGSDVSSAVLELYATGWGGADITLGAYYITRTVSLCEATWNRAKADLAWGLAGANNVLTDRRAVPESTLTTFGVPRWYRLDITSVAQGWVDGSLANNGVLIRAAYSLSSLYFAGSQNSSVSSRPRLIITYRTNDGPTPTPSPTLPGLPTASPTPTSVGLPTATPTATRTATRTSTPTPTLSATPSPTPGTGPVTLNLQQGLNGYYGTADTQIDMYYPSTNYCAGDSFLVGYKQRYGSFVRFDLSAIPPGATIISATLRIYAAAWSGTDISIGAHVILRQTEICQITWNQASSGNRWGVAGANDTATDRRALPESAVMTHGPRQYYSFELRNAVQQWVGGLLPNNGVMLRATSSTSTSLFYFSSAENATGTSRPQLSVTYYP